MKTIRDSLEAEGIEVIGADDHVLSPDQEITETVYDTMVLDDEIGAVVYGLDNSFTH